MPLSDKNYLLTGSGSQLPHKIVNLISQLVIVNNKLTILGGGRLSKTSDRDGGGGGGAAWRHLIRFRGLMIQGSGGD